MHASMVNAIVTTIREGLKMNTTSTGKLLELMVRCYYFAKLSIEWISLQAPDLDIVAEVKASPILHLLYVWLHGVCADLSVLPSHNNTAIDDLCEDLIKQQHQAMARAADSSISAMEAAASMDDMLMWHGLYLQLMTSFQVNLSSEMKSFRLKCLLLLKKLNCSDGINGS
jgi:hypothetical protein